MPGLDSLLAMLAGGAQGYSNWDKGRQADAQLKFEQQQKLAEQARMEALTAAQIKNYQTDNDLNAQKAKQLLADQETSRVMKQAAQYKPTIAGNPAAGIEGQQGDPLDFVLSSNFAKEGVPIVRTRAPFEAPKPMDLPKAGLTAQMSAPPGAEPVVPTASAPIKTSGVGFSAPPVDTRLATQPEEEKYIKGLEASDTLKALRKKATAQSQLGSLAGVTRETMTPAQLQLIMDAEKNPNEFVGPQGAPPQAAESKFVTPDGRPLERRGTAYVIAGTAEPYQGPVKTPVDPLVGAIREQTLEGLKAKNAVDPELVDHYAKQAMLNKDFKDIPKKYLDPIAKQLAQQGVNIVALTNQTKTMAEGARMVLPHVDSVQKEAEQLAKMGLIGPLQGRWREFIAGKIGSDAVAPTPEGQKLVGKFRTDIGLLKSGLARVHGGARGGGSPAMLAYMDKLLNGESSDLTLLQGTLSGVHDWLDGYAHPDGSAEPNGPQAPPAANGATPTVVKWGRDAQGNPVIIK